MYVYRVCSSILTLYLVHAEHLHHLCATDTDQLRDGANAATAQLAQQDHPFQVVVLEEGDIGTYMASVNFV